MKFSVTIGRLWSLPQPLQRKTQPTVMRANNGASQVRCRATLSGQSISQRIRYFTGVLESLWCLGVKTGRAGAILPLLAGGPHIIAAVQSSRGQAQFPVAIPGLLHW